MWAGRFSYDDVQIFSIYSCSVLKWDVTALMQKVLNRVFETKNPNISNMHRLWNRWQKMQNKSTLGKKPILFLAPPHLLSVPSVGFHRIQAVDMILHFLIELKHNIRILLKMLTDMEWSMGLSTLNQKLMLFQSLFKHCIRSYKVLRLGL